MNAVSRRQLAGNEKDAGSGQLAATTGARGGRETVGSGGRTADSWQATETGAGVPERKVDG
jgi:hypothetical protein